MIASQSLLREGSGAGTSTSARVGKNILLHFHLKKKQKLLLNTILKSINKKNSCDLISRSGRCKWLPVQNTLKQLIKNLEAGKRKTRSEI
jgi:hypothetical protein